MKWWTNSWQSSWHNPKPESWNKSSHCRTKLWGKPARRPFKSILMAWTTWSLPTSRIWRADTKWLTRWSSCWRRETKIWLGCIKKPQLSSSRRVWTCSRRRTWRPRSIPCRGASCLTSRTTLSCARCTSKTGTRLSYSAKCCAKTLETIGVQRPTKSPSIWPTWGCVSFAKIKGIWMKWRSLWLLAATMHLNTI